MKMKCGPQQGQGSYWNAPYSSWKVDIRPWCETSF